ncbi:MAG: SMP-30/gluconolactonase/LRE family protein [Ignavibacteriaceae bacterium]
MNKFYYIISVLYTSLIFAQSPVPEGAVLEKIATGFKFVEGPVWNDSLGLLFSDIEGNTIYQWSPVDSIKPYLQPSDSSNGLAYDNQGRLILTQMRLRRIARQETDGTLTPLVTNYNGKKFHCPNDLAVKSDGSIFFTDPDFNIPFPYNKELTFKGIYRLSPSGTVTVLDTSFDKPNGICFSPDEKKLYVNESPRGQIYEWDVVDDSTISNKKLLYQIPVNGYADGMKTDPDGNIYCTGPTGIWIVSPSGELLDRIDVPESARNCNWGDADRKTLYITAGKSLYRIRLASATGVKDEGNLIKPMELYPNYPNPFNPVTEIKYSVSKKLFTTLKIYDLLGKEIQTLVSEEKTAGTYSVEFDASKLSSGTYLYQLTAGNFAESRKLILLK